jgi:hypothetical protein
VSERKRSTITVGDRTWAGPEDPELKEGETASMTDDVDQPVGKVELPEHIGVECDHNRSRRAEADRQTVAPVASTHTSVDALYQIGFPKSSSK